MTDARPGDAAPHRHDFVTQQEGPKQTGQNWTLNFDGTVDAEGLAVKGGVLDFFNDATHPENMRQISTSYQERSWWTWAVRK